MCIDYCAKENENCTGCKKMEYFDEDVYLTPSYEPIEYEQDDDNMYYDFVYEV